MENNVIWHEAWRPSLKRTVNLGEETIYLRNRLHWWPSLPSICIWNQIDPIYFDSNLPSHTICAHISFISKNVGTIVLGQGINGTKLKCITIYTTSNIWSSSIFLAYLSLAIFRRSPFALTLLVSTEPERYNSNLHKHLHRFKFYFANKINGNLILLRSEDLKNDLWPQLGPRKNKNKIRGNASYSTRAQPYVKAVNYSENMCKTLGRGTVVMIEKNSSAQTASPKIIYLARYSCKNPKIVCVALFCARVHHIKTLTNSQQHEEFGKSTKYQFIQLELQKFTCISYMLFYYL